MTQPDRIPCVVPYCGRTGKRLPTDTTDTEFLCPNHSKLVDRRLRRTFHKAKKVATLVYETWEADCLAAPDKAHAEAERLAHKTEARAQLFWDRMKKQAIERAVGITA